MLPMIEPKTPSSSSSSSSPLLSLPRLTSFVVVVLVLFNQGQVGSWSGRGCCEFTHDARCRRVCLRVRVFVRVFLCVYLSVWVRRSAADYAHRPIFVFWGFCSQTLPGALSMLLEPAGGLRSPKCTPTVPPNPGFATVNLRQLIGLSCAVPMHCSLL